MSSIDLDTIISILKKKGPDLKYVKELMKIRKEDPGNMDVNYVLLWLISTLKTEANAYLKKEYWELIDTVLKLSEGARLVNKPESIQKARSWALYGLHCHKKNIKDLDIIDKVICDLIESVSLFDFGLNKKLLLSYRSRSRSIEILRRVNARKGLPYYLITEYEASKKFKLHKLIKGLYGNEYLYRVYPKNVTFKDGFNTSKELSIEGEEMVMGYIFIKNLTVHGVLYQPDSNFGETVVVMGDLKASNVDKGGAEFVIKGDMTVDQSIHGFYNHGTLTVYGKTKAETILCNRHYFYFSKKPKGTLINLGSVEGAKPHYSSETAHKTIHQELLDSNGHINSEKISEFIKNGKSVIKKK